MADLSPETVSVFQNGRGIRLICVRVVDLMSSEIWVQCNGKYQLVLCADGNVDCKASVDALQLYIGRAISNDTPADDVAEVKEHMLFINKLYHSVLRNTETMKHHYLKIAKLLATHHQYNVHFVLDTSLYITGQRGQKMHHDSQKITEKIERDDTRKRCCNRCFTTKCPRCHKRVFATPVPSIVKPVPLKRRPPSGLDLLAEACEH